MESVERLKLRVEPPVAPSAPARLRWSGVGGTRELPLDALQGGLRLIPVGAEGRDLLQALLGALDRAAAGEPPPVRHTSRAIEVTVEIPPDWPAPPKPPSEVLAGPSGWPAAPRPDELDGARLVARALATVGVEGLELLRAYPRRRRSIASWRRRLESAQWQLDLALRERGRAASLAAAGALAATAGVLAAAGLRQAWLSLAGGAATLAFALASAAARRELRLLRERRARREERLARLDLRYEEIERRARTAARELGSNDPWALSSRLDRAEVRRFEAASRLDPGPETQRWASRLAELVGCDPPVDPGSWELGAPADLSGWPLAVAALRAGSDQRAVAALARVAERVDRDLPAPWPVVLFEPWPGDDAGARARRLMALVRAFPDRAVVALVSQR